MSGHTQGPWKLDTTWGLIMGPNGQEVAAIHTGDSNARPNPAIAAANARLIEAAPAMLEALQAVLQFAAYNPEFETEEHDWLKLTRASIAQVEGR